MIERNITNYFKTLTAKLPYAYFIVFGLWLAFEGVLNGSIMSLVVLIVCIPFFYQLKFENRILNIILGSLLLFWSFWMTLAYISDITQIIAINNHSLRFIIIGGVIVLFNFLASISILRKTNADKINPISIA